MISSNAERPKPKGREAAVDLRGFTRQACGGHSREPLYVMPASTIMSPVSGALPLAAKGMLSSCGSGSHAVDHVQHVSDWPPGDVCLPMPVVLPAIQITSTAEERLCPAAVM